MNYRLRERESPDQRDAKCEVTIHRNFRRGRGRLRGQEVGGATSAAQVKKAQSETDGVVSLGSQPRFPG